MANPLVYMDISISSKPPNRIIIELYTDTTPNIANAFKLLCTGEKGQKLHYKGSQFYNVSPTRCQGGFIDLSKAQLASIYSFKPENFNKRHDGPGTVSMLSCTGPDFFICGKKMPVLDGTFVVVGKVAKGINVVNDVMSVGMVSGIMKCRVVITDCGEFREPLVSPISASQKMPIKESPISASQKISIKKPKISPASASQKIPITEPLVSPVSVSQKIPLKEPLVSQVSASQKIPIKEPLISPISEARKMLVKEYEKVISTSNAQLSNTLKEIINAKRQMTGVDDKDVLILESEEDLEEVASVLEDNLKPLMDLKAEVCSLEKHQNDLLTQTRTRISNIKKTKHVLEMIPSLPYEDLVNIENVIKKRKKTDCQ